MRKKKIKLWMYIAEGGRPRFSEHPLFYDGIPKELEMTEYEGEFVYEIKNKEE